MLAELRCGFHSTSCNAMLQDRIRSSYKELLHQARKLVSAQRMLEPLTQGLSSPNFRTRAVVLECLAELIAEDGLACCERSRARPLPHIAQVPGLPPGLLLRCAGIELCIMLCILQPKNLSAFVKDLSSKVTDCGPTFRHAKQLAGETELLALIMGMIPLDRRQANDWRINARPLLNLNHFRALLKSLNFNTGHEVIRYCAVIAKELFDCMKSGCLFY